MTVLGYRKTKGLEAVLRLRRSISSTVDSSRPASNGTAPAPVAGSLNWLPSGAIIYESETSAGGVYQTQINENRNVQKKRASRIGPQQELFSSVDVIRNGAKGTARWRKAPNGKPTNLTEEQRCRECRNFCGRLCMIAMQGSPP